MMTIREVPTNTPIPMVETNRNRDWERGKERGSKPARKDLASISLDIVRGWGSDTHATAITVLKMININSPSNMVADMVVTPVLLSSKEKSPSSGRAANCLYLMAMHDG